MITEIDISASERILIAASIAAVVGGRFRIVEITPVEGKPATEWERRSRMMQPVRRPIEMRPRPKEEPLETADHA